MPAAFAFTAGEGDNMDLLLNRFGYLFSMEGRQGGLFSMEWHFLPAPGADRDEAGMEAALRVHVDMLDRVFASVILGKRVESLLDSPGRRKVEYSYRGRLTLLGALLARRRLGSCSVQRLPARTFIPSRAASRKRPLRGSGTSRRTAAAVPG